MLVVSCALDHRLLTLFEDFQDVGEDENFCDNGIRELDLDELIKNCRLLIVQICSIWREAIGDAATLHDAASNSSLFQHMLSLFHPRVSLTEIRPEHLPDLLSHQMQMMI